MSKIWQPELEMFWNFEPEMAKHWELLQEQPSFPDTPG